MANWTAVAKHLAENVMNWHIDRYFWADKANNTKMSISAWKPYEHWNQIGRVIDKMKECYCYLSLFYSRDREKFIACFYSSKLEEDFIRASQETEQRAIALAAALATGYIEEETEAIALLMKLYKKMLFRKPLTGKCGAIGDKEWAIEQIEQSFERVRKEKIKGTVDYEHLRKVFKAAVRLRPELVWHNHLAYARKVTTSKEQSALDDLLMETQWVEDEWGDKCNGM